ncbi:hypothetical protein HPB48_008449 [Haemaphysalis longicornis]|uniref:Uncharacterized protein n=1 Tax=Haemaphysalis longicornis TaxID=44386 RepID=A0A9J6GYI7_HAELO|nr:hypothetical protein HPB48_008449 [Haemaphysalis longicornis]
MNMSQFVDLASTLRQNVREEVFRHNDATRPWTTHDSYSLHDAPQYCYFPTTHVESLRQSDNVADFVDNQGCGKYTN